MTSNFLIFFIPLLMFVGTMWYLFSGRQSKSPDPSVMIGQMAPQMFSSFLGRIHMINIMSTWCQDRPHEPEILNRLAKEGMPIGGLFYRDKQEDVDAWLKDHGDPYGEQRVDEQGDSLVVWGATEIPTTYIIDKEGIIREILVGEIASYDEIVAILQEIYEAADKDTNK